MAAVSSISSFAFVSKINEEVRAGHYGVKAVY